MTEWDVNDYRDMRDFQEESKADRRAEARHEAQEEEWLKTALHCANCGFRWAPGWEPKNKELIQKMSDNHGACPRCGSLRKASR